jgi:ABC-type Mn2+/Zn2+ transport system permease subunit
MELQTFFSLIVAFFVGGVSAYLGSLMLTKRMALVGDALGHIALPGMGLALLFNINVFWGALIFLLLGIFLIWLIEMRTALPLETLVGVIFVISLAIGFLIIPEPELIESLIGDISKVKIFDVFLAIFLSLTTLYFVQKIYPNLLLINLSKDLAKSQNISIEKTNLIYLLTIAAIVATGIKIAGSLLVGALLIVPAATAKNLAQSFKGYMKLSAFFGIFSSFLGVILSSFFNINPGPLIVLISSLFFLFSLFKKRI